MSRHVWWGPLAILIAGVLLLGGSRDPIPPPPASGGERVISLAPSLTEIIIALGAGDRLVGVTRYCEGVDPQIERFGGLSFDFEKILATKPDLVIAIETKEQMALLGALAERDIPVLTLPAESVADILAAIEVLGARWRVPDVAAVLAARIEDSLVPSTEPPIPVMFVVERRSRTVAGGGSFVDDMLRAAGLVNVFGDQSWSYGQVPFEEMLARDPVLILDASFGETDLHSYWSRFEGLRAVREDGVRLFPPVVPGPKIPKWIDLLEQEALRRRP